MAGQTVSMWRAIVARLHHHGLVLGLALVCGAVSLVMIASMTRRELAPTTAWRSSEPPNRAYSRRHNDPSTTIDTLDPARWPIVDVHEHVQDAAQAEVLLRAMDELGIQTTCLMGTSRYTFTLDRRDGFTDYLEHNEAMLAVKRDHPDRFCVFVTLNPLDSDNPARLADYVRRGADGLKLYLGHGGHTGHEPFHTMPLDDPRMLEVYAWAESTALPIVLHVNLTKYFDEFERTMERFPGLRVLIPHFGLHKNSKARLKRLGELLDRYPHLYTDISFGWHEYQVEGFEALAKWRKRSRKFITQYAHKIAFGADLVVTPNDSFEIVRRDVQSYRQLLEARRFRFHRRPEFLMHGIRLDEKTLEQIYVHTPAAFLGRARDKGSAEPDIVSPYDPASSAPLSITTSTEQRARSD